MYRGEDFLRGMLQIISTVFVLWLFLYFLLYFLPALLIIGGIYFLYIFIRMWLIKRRLRDFGASLENSEDKYSKEKIIDAEYEILDEKVQK